MYLLLWDKTILSHNIGFDPLWTEFQRIYLNQVLYNSTGRKKEKKTFIAFSSFFWWLVYYRKLMEWIEQVWILFLMFFYVVI